LAQLGHEGVKVGRHRFKLAVAGQLSYGRPIQLRRIGQELATKINDLVNAAHK
jgi:hypothetical protein